MRLSSCSWVISTRCSVLEASQVAAGAAGHQRRREARNVRQIEQAPLGGLTLASLHAQKLRRGAGLQADVECSQREIQAAARGLDEGLLARPAIVESLEFF